MRRITMDAAELRKKIDSMGFWYHNIQLAPGVWTNPARGDYPRSRWNVIEPYVPADLTGKSVLDLSCNAGFFSIEMKKRGASRVVGVERFGPTVKQAQLVTEVLGVDIEIVHDDVYSFLWNNTETFDYVFYMGLFYHLRAPLFILDRVALVVREKLYFQTVLRGDDWGSPEPNVPDDIDINDLDVFRQPNFPKAYFVEKLANGDTSNWWFVNTSCVHAMLRSAGLTCYHQVSDDTFVCDAPPDLSAVPTYGTLW
jgi:tRNA (mo5U34)-methyltransferase